MVAQQRMAPPQADAAADIHLGDLRVASSLSLAKSESTFAPAAEPWATEGNILDPLTTTPARYTPAVLVSQA